MDNTNTLFDTVNLGEGLNLHFISGNAPKKFKTAVICILIRSKLTRENATVNAVIPSVLQNGSQKYRTLSEINSATEMMYGAVFDIQVVKKGEEQIIQFFLEYISADEGEFADNKDRAIEFLYEVMLKPLVCDGGFINEAVETAKQNVKNMIETRINNKSEYAKLRCVEEMCTDEPFGIYADGYSDDLPGLTRQEIYTHYMQLLKNSPIEFIFTGDTDKDFYLEKVKNLFVKELETLGRSKRYEDFIIPRAEIIYKNDKEKYISENLNITQGKICMGYRTGIDPVSAEFYDLLMFNELFGGSANSRLFLEIREKQNLCYFVNSFVFRFKSIVMVRSGVDSSNIPRFIESVEKLVTDMQNPDKIDCDEFENAKKSIMMKYKGIPDNQNSMIEFYLSQYLLLDAPDLDTVINKLSAVSKAGVSETAKKIKLDVVFTLSGEDK